jgi:hypothetical protein
MNPAVVNAFRNPSALKEADYVELVAAMKKDAKAATVRRNRTQRTGGTDGRELHRNAAYRERRAELRKQKVVAE